MTVGIGTLCTHKRPLDCLILASDKLGSFGDEFSTRRLAKLFIEGEDRMFAVASGSVENASELLGKITECWRALPKRNFGHIRAGIQEAAHAYRKYRFLFDVMPDFGIGPKDDWELVKKIGAERRLFKAWNKFDIGCDLLLATYTDDKQAILYHLAGLKCEITQLTAPGFGAIGVGARNAMFWLSYREQAMGMSLLRTAYHVLEAKIMAEQSAHVGRDDIELLICTPERWWGLSDRAPTSDGCPISLPQLKELFVKHGPQSTESLGGL